MLLGKQPLIQRLFLGLCALASPLLLAAPAHAATYYVAAATGDDANTCEEARAEGTPKKTIQEGVECLAGGDTLIVKAGTYTNQGIRNPPGGTPGAYTVIKGDPSGPRPILKPDAAELQRGFYCGNGAGCSHIEWRYFEVDGAYEHMKLDGSVTAGYPHHMTIIDNVFHDSTMSGFLIASSTTGFQGGDHLIRGNEFYNTGSGYANYGPGFNTIYNPGNRTVVEHNVFHDTANNVGIWRTDSTGGVKDIHNIIVRSNLFYDVGLTKKNTWIAGANGYGAVGVAVPGGGHQVYNNVMYRSCDVPQCKFFIVKMYGGEERASKSAPIQVYNNTVYDHQHANAYGIKFEGESGGPHVVANNILYKTGTDIINKSSPSHKFLSNLTTDPSFVNAAGWDLRLLEGSAAIDAGETLDSVKNDFLGVLRPQGAGYDIGAYEWCAEGSCGSDTGTGTGSGAGPGSGSTSNGTSSAGNGVGSTSGGTGGMHAGLGGQDGIGDGAEGDGAMVGTCSCSVGANQGSRALGFLSVAALAWLVSRQRRARG